MLLKQKVLLLGDGAVGKTSLVHRFVWDKFEDFYMRTIGAKVMKKNIFCDGVELTMIIWDLLGQHGFAPIQEHHIKGCRGAILVADLTRRETLWNLTQYWVPMIHRVERNIPMIFLANKADLVREWEFDKDELLQAATAHNASSLVTCAKTGWNVDEAFHAIGRNLVQIEKRFFNDPLFLEDI